MKVTELFLTENIVIKEDDVLIVVDVQNDFLQGGSLEVNGGNDIIQDINIVGEKFKHAGARIIFTQDWHPVGHWSFASSHEGKNPFDPITGVYGIGPILWPDHCIQGSRGSEFHEDLNVDLAHLIIRKGFHQKIDSYSAILENDKKTETGLDGYLKTSNLKRIFVCGLALDYCVNFSAIDAAKKGYEVIVIYDLTKGIADDTISEAIKGMNQANVQFANKSNFQ